MKIIDLIAEKQEDIIQNKHSQKIPTIAFLGDSVTQGQAIGTVAAPTKYGSALGTHLEFAMEQNGAPQDPAKYLK